MKRLAYPGLRAFTADESDLFFGRENCVDDMVARFASTRFLTVLGPSGSGKSSLVRTGFKDALDLGLHPWAGSHWKIADMHPGDQPMHNLAAALVALDPAQNPDGIHNDTDIDLLTAFLTNGPRAIVEWVSGGNLEPGWNLLIMVDQFEELFRYGDYAQREEAEAFAALLMESADDPAFPIHVVLTMRSEYLGACALITGLADRINAGLYLTPRMGREECRAAIEGPAGVNGFKVEPALVNRLLNDLGSFAPWEAGARVDQAERISRQADQLPVMQHVLNRLWVKADAESNGVPVVLRLADYNSLGGLSGALDAHGAEIMAALGPRLTLPIENVFRGLVSGTSVALAIRRPCPLGELVQLTGRRDDTIAIVEAFRAAGCNFLRTSGPSLAHNTIIVDISHESLIRQWTPLRAWLEKEARASASWQRMVDAQQRHSTGEGGLLTGLDLQNLAAWWDSACPTKAWAQLREGDFDAVGAFLAKSRTAESSRTDADNRRRLQERNRLRTYVAGLAFALALFAGLTVFGVVETGRAKKARDEAEAQRGAVNTARLEAVHNAEAARAAQAAANKDAARTAKVLDDVSDVIYSDKFRELIGVAELQSVLMSKLLGYQADLSKQHSDVVNLNSKIRDDYRQGLAFETTGKAQEALQSFKSAYENGRRAIEGLHGSRLDEQLETSFLKDATRYGWFLYDIGELEKGDAVLQAEVSLVGRFSPPADNRDLLLAHAGMENLESRYYDDHKKPELDRSHAEKYLDLTAKAAALAGTDIAALKEKHNALRNLSFKAKGQEEEQLEAKACNLAEEMIALNPNNISSIEARVSCLKDRSARLLQAQKPDLAIAEIRTAEELIYRALRMAPDSQTLLLGMASLENSLADRSYGAGQEKALFDHRMAAKNFMVKALKGRTLFQSNTSQLKTLYTNTKNIAFEHDYEALAFYKEIFEAMSPTLAAFPKAPSFTYVAADSSSEIGKLLQTDKRRASEAEPYLTHAIAWYDKAGVMTDLSVFSENYSAYCQVYRQRAEMYSSLGKFESMQADMKKMRDVCTPPLDKYPWDYYLRSQILGANKMAGKALFQNHRYNDALPYLEYASHWGNHESSIFLAQAYRDGLSVRKNEARAKELEALAAKQSLKRFTIPCDFNGTKSPFNIYVGEYPEEYRSQFPGIDDQAKWLKEARGGIVPPEVVESFQKLQKIALENKVSFPELCVYALGDAETSKAVETAHSKFNSDSTTANLESWRVASNKRYDELVKDKKPTEAGTLDKELVAAAEPFVRKTPEPAAYRVAWQIFFTHAERIKEKDVEGGRQAFTHSIQFAELLPSDNYDDLYDRILSYERLGDLENQAGRTERARELYAKEAEADRKRFTIKGTPENLTALKLSLNRFYEASVKLGNQTEADKVESELVQDADRLLTQNQDPVALRAAWDVFKEWGDLKRTAHPVEAAKAYERSATLAEKLPADNLDDLNKRLTSHESLGDIALVAADLETARSWYLQLLEDAQRRYKFKPAFDTFSVLSIATNKLSAVFTKLNQPGRAAAVLKELTQATDTMTTGTPTGTTDAISR